MATRLHTRQKFEPILGKYADKAMAEPLLNTNNTWQQWFHILLTVVMTLTDQKHLKAASSIKDLPASTALQILLKCLKETVKCSRLHKNVCNWFSDKRATNIRFSYRFTGKH